MSERDSGPVEAIRGVIEDVIGKAKEITGIVINHGGLRDEGRAQQDKAQAKRDVAKKEAQAEAARAGRKHGEGPPKAAREALKGAGPGGLQLTFHRGLPRLGIHSGSFVSAISKCHQATEVLRGSQTDEASPEFPNDRARIHDGCADIVTAPQPSSPYGSPNHRFQMIR